ncbi:hypothetical protein L873DRAFT_1443407 [Choiromyces venosus 120613-1]|uniref:Uncharacterized protein n=1 Tax=Choiromyces venosus 120613-1 TaxID=1336337 RepID=A0A3N4J7Y4_9PEZI|nr:hypothetical protein L873DRAFT_1443407 [Choiromyces venosus 120613-1]
MLSYPQTLVRWHILPQELFTSTVTRGACYPVQLIISMRNKQPSPKVIDRQRTPAKKPSIRQTTFHPSNSTTRQTPASQ